MVPPASLFGTDRLWNKNAGDPAACAQASAGAGDKSLLGCVEAQLAFRTEDHGLAAQTYTLVQLPDRRRDEIWQADVAVVAVAGPQPCRFTAADDGHAVD